MKSHGLVGFRVGFATRAVTALSISLIVVALLVAGCTPLVNRMAFFPGRAHLVPVDQLPAGINPVVLAVEGQPRLAGYLLPSAQADRMLIYFHGNAESIDDSLPVLMRLRDMRVNVLAVEFRGYGRSEGHPSEAGIYADGEAAWDYATDALGYRPENVILLGRSIGTAVALHVAAERRPGGLILVSPLTTAKGVARYHGLGLISWLAGNAFNNLAQCGKIEAPTLVIHGRADNVIPVAMGIAIFEAIPAPKRLVLVDGAGHNDLDGREEYWEAIREFLTTTAPHETFVPNTELSD